MGINNFRRFGFTFGLAVVCGATAFSQLPGTIPGQVSKSTEKMFIENKGQWDSDALFLSRQPGLDYWVTRKGLKIDVHQYERDTKGGPAQEDGDSGPRGISRKGSVVSFDFVGAGHSAEPIATGPSKSRMGFYVGDASKHASDVGIYGEATVRNLMPGVNMRNYYEAGASRYDLVVRPGADARQVMFDIKGANQVSVVNGELVIDTPSGQLKQGGLFAYQKSGNAVKVVSAKFKMVGPNRVGFDVGEYDSRRDLIIDPLVYGTYIGSQQTSLSSGIEEVNGISADNEGNVFLTGWTSSITFPVTDGPYGFALEGGEDAFLIRLQGDAYDTTYVAYLGGTSVDNGMRVSYNQTTGDLWIAGETSSTDFPGVVSGVPTGPDDIFLSRFNVSESGTISPAFSLYYTNMGAAATFFRKIWLESNSDGSFYLGGNADGALLGGGFQPYLAGGGGDVDGFLTKFDSSGSVIWERQVGSVLTDSIGKFGVDSGGNVVMVGSFGFSGSEDTSTAGSPTFVTTSGVYPEGRLIRSGDMFVVKIDANGDTVFASLLGGSVGEVAFGAAFDANGDVFVVGNTGSFDFPRNEGAYDETPAGSMTASKIKFDGSQILYSTGLQTTGNVYATGVAVDKNGNLIIGGNASWSINPLSTLIAAAAAIPSTIPIVGGLDAGYTDGTNATFSNGAIPAGGCPPTDDGFMIYLNSSGTGLIYSSYIGNVTNDRITDIFVDSTRATWFAGYSSAMLCDTVPPALKPGTNGISPYITGNAAKPTFDAYEDGWLVKLRVGQAIVNSVSLNPLTIGGGLGATSVATISLRDPAPVGGVTLTATLSNSAATSFTAGAGSVVTSIFVPQGTTTVTKTIYSLPVTSIQTSDLRVSLENDFVLARVTVKPWLDSFSVAPGTIVGGNGLTLTATLPQPAISAVTVNLSTSRPDLITLPNPATLTVPVGATSGSIIVQTAGVVTQQSAAISASFLGVSKTANVTLNPATLSSLTFNPPTVNGGSDSTGTATFNGKLGAARDVTISYVSGEVGTLINGGALPAIVSAGAQTSSVTFTAKAPSVSGSGFVTMSANDGVTGVNGTLFIESIDIADLVVTPSLDVLGGTLLKGQVFLTGPAGSGGFVVDLASSNTAAATVAAPTITIPQGATSSALFNIPTNLVASDTTATISASKTGFTTSSEVINVRANQLSLSLAPTTVVGGVNSTGTVTLVNPAPAGGTLVSLSSSIGGATVPASVLIAEGTKTATFTVTTAMTITATSATITATASVGVSDSKVLTIQAQTLSLSLSPISVYGGLANSVGTITLNGAAPAGGVVVTLSSSQPSYASVPTDVTVSAGATSANFTITTSATTVDRIAAITATTSVGATNSKNLTVLAPVITGLSIDPSSLIGPGTTSGVVSINVLAPAGGVTVVINHDGGGAVSAPATVTIPQGSNSAGFLIDVLAVAVDTNVTVTATFGSSSDETSFLIRVPRIESLVFSPSKLQGGGITIGTVTLSSVAPTGGLQINVASLDPTFASIIGPTLLTIPAGSRTAVFTVGTSRVNRLIAVQFQASITGSTQMLSGTVWIKP